MRFALLATAFCLPLFAQDKKPDAKKADEKKLPRIAINDPVKLKDNPVFSLQGTYEAESKKHYFNVIATGETDFQTSWSQGPAWDGTRITNDLKVQREGNTAEILITSKELTGSPNIGKIAEGKVTLFGDTYTRVDRKSPTLDVKPPADATILFNLPDDLAKWEKSKTVKLSDGEFLGVGGRTKQKFQSFTMHLEFRLPWMPNSTGQARGNSGVYLQDRYEIQVLDSFGLKGEDNECGGIYKIAKPKVNMCFPPMTWQTYDIDFTAAQFENGKKTKNAIVTIKHNGVVIHDKLELKSHTPGGAFDKESPEPGSLFLQDHGDPVVFRNIWIVEKK